MRSSELAMQLSELLLAADHLIEANIGNLDAKFVPDPALSNEVNAKAFDHHKAVTRLLIYQHLNSAISAELKKAKDSINETAIEVGCDPTGTTGMTDLISDTGVLTFHKKRNNDGVSLNVKDLVTELRLLGVEKDVIEKAQKSAEGVRMGNTYYLIGASE